MNALRLSCASHPRSAIRPHIALLLLMPLLLATCDRTIKATPTPEQAPAIKAPAVLRGDTRVHDPALIRQGGSYYVFSTGDERGLNHGTIQIRRSTDLTTWELAGTVFADIPSWIGEAIGGTP